MTNQQLSQQAYLDAVNTALHNSDIYVEGMEVVGIADHYDSLADLSAYLWEGPDYIASDLQLIVAQVSQQFSLLP